MTTGLQTMLLAGGLYLSVALVLSAGFTAYLVLILRFGEVLYRIVTGRDTRLNLSDEAAAALKSDLARQDSGESGARP